MEQLPQTTAGKSVPSCRVFAVDNDKLGVVFPAQLGDQLFDGLSAAFADNVAYKYKLQYIPPKTPGSAGKSLYGGG